MLLSIIEIINITRSSGLPSYITSYKVQFRQKLIQLEILTPASRIASSLTVTRMSMAPVEANSNSDSNVLPDDNEVDPNYMLLELHR